MAFTPTPASRRVRRRRSSPVRSSAGSGTLTLAVEIARRMPGVAAHVRRGAAPGDPMPRTGPPANVTLRRAARHPSSAAGAPCCSTAPTASYLRNGADRGARGRSASRRRAGRGRAAGDPGRRPGYGPATPMRRVTRIKLALAHPGPARAPSSSMSTAASRASPPRSTKVAVPRACRPTSRFELGRRHRPLPQPRPCWRGCC